MSDLFWLSDSQMSRLKPFFPKSHGKPRVDDKRVLSGIIYQSQWLALAGCPVRIRPRKDTL